MKQTPDPSPAFVEAVNNFISDTLHNGDRATFDYQTGCFYHGHLCGNLMSESQRESAAMWERLMPQLLADEAAHPTTPTGSEPMPRGLQYHAWTDGTAATVRAFMEAHGLDAGLFADVWLLFCAVHYRVQGGWDKKTAKPFIDGLADAKQQIERDVLPLIAGLYGTDAAGVRRGASKFPAGNGSIAVKFSTGGGESVTLTGWLAQTALDDLRKSSLELMKDWEARPEIKKERKDLVRTGIADSAKLIFQSMKAWNILKAQTAFNANAEQKRFIWAFLVAAGIDMESMADKYYNADYIKELLSR